MKSWNRGSHNLTLKNGEVIKEYFIEYRTTSMEEILLLETICEDLIDKKFDRVFRNSKGEKNENTTN